jgi:hypothetical protein
LSEYDNLFEEDAGCSGMTKACLADRLKQQLATVRGYITSHASYSTTDPENATQENGHGVHADKQLNGKIFKSRLVQSIRETTANIEKISSFEWEDMDHQDPKDVF